MESRASYVRMAQWCWESGEGAQDMWNPQTPKSDSDVDTRQRKRRGRGKVQGEGQDAAWKMELEVNIGS